MQRDQPRRIGGVGQHRRGRSHLSGADKDALLARHVALDIDLRTPAEIASAPDPLATDPRFKYLNVSLMGDKLDMAHMPPTLGQSYVDTLAHEQARFRQVF